MWTFPSGLGTKTIPDHQSVGSWTQLTAPSSLHVLQLFLYFGQHWDSHTTWCGEGEGSGIAAELDSVLPFCLLLANTFCLLKIAFFLSWNSTWTFPLPCCTFYSPWPTHEMGLVYRQPQPPWNRWGCWIWLSSPFLFRPEVKWNQSKYLIQLGHSLGLLNLKHSGGAM